MTAGPASLDAGLFRDAFRAKRFAIGYAPSALTAMRGWYRMYFLQTEIAKPVLTRTTPPAHVTNRG